MPHAYLQIEFYLFHFDEITIHLCNQQVIYHQRLNK